jgi:RNA polymerase sigma-70 factor (ECF subfamily)
LENTNHNIALIIQACRSGNRAAQKRLYQLYFAYGMSVALRYAGEESEAEDIFNESFFKVFSKLDQYDERYDFKKWFRRVLINTAIDYQRRYKKMRIAKLDPEYFEQINYTSNEGWENLLYEDIIAEIQNLTPGYRIVFNLYAIDGYKHQEIAEQLNISVGSSRSNYARARTILQERLQKKYTIKKVSNER